MKSVILLPSILICVVVFSQPKLTPKDKSEISIRKVLNEQVKAWNRGDVVGYMQGYWKNDSLMFIGKNGINWSWTKTLENYKKSYPDTTTMGKLSFDILLVKELSSTYYYVVGKWTLKRSIGDLSGYYNLLFKKINGQWLIIADHTS
ncbi:MAG TPA: nuclear transport factor 2 family protein [Chitinophagaceae bacterium]|jgi:ketosteroid isomerase-like protein|nr:nuclear transport factor 2 family protein [Chitinophagaceae bacterium]